MRDRLGFHIRNWPQVFILLSLLAVLVLSGCLPAERPTGTPVFTPLSFCYAAFHLAG